MDVSAFARGVRAAMRQRSSRLTSLARCAVVRRPTWDAFELREGAIDLAFEQGLAHLRICDRIPWRRIDPRHLDRRGLTRDPYEPVVMRSVVTTADRGHVR